MASQENESGVTCVWANCTIAAPHEHRGYSPVGVIPARFEQH